MDSRRWRQVGVLGILLVVGAGCGGGPDKPVPVQGKVTLDGQPVGGAAIQFLPDASGRWPAFAATQDDGSYRITTKDSGDGALPGGYRVVITWEPPPPPMFRKSEEGGPSRLEMQKAIEEHQAKQKKAGKGPSIPAIYGDPTKTPLKVNVPAPGGRADFDLKSKS